jgi:A/G-specific adenine glycosylase
MTSDVIIADSNVDEFRRSLVDWWHENGREFPWRNTNNVFYILISEIMLQRTKADQVVSVFNDFISKYSTPDDVVNASKEDISQTLFSLGLPQRIDQIIKMAKQIKDDFQGNVPETYIELRKLPGVGDYIASAVCCFGYGQPVIVVDTNTVRIIGRLFGIATHAESRRQKHIRHKHEFLLDPIRPRSYNFALLDLGALVCTSDEPDCVACPILNYCHYGKQNNTSQNSI